MKESFRMVSERKHVIPMHTDEEHYGEICEIKIEGSTRMVDFFVDYNSKFDEWLKRRLKK